MYQITVLASNQCTRLLDGYKVEMAGKNCPNYTINMIKEKIHGQLCKNWGKITGNCLILAKTVYQIECEMEGLSYYVTINMIL